MRCKVKVRQQAGGGESRVPGLLVDAVVKETASVVVTKDQIAALAHIARAFQANNRNR